jgi:hypothetical protein
MLSVTFNNCHRDYQTYWGYCYKELAIDTVVNGLKPRSTISKL